MEDAIVSFNARLGPQIAARSKDAVASFNVGLGPHIAANNMLKDVVASFKVDLGPEIAATTILKHAVAFANARSQQQLMRQCHGAHVQSSASPGLDELASEIVTVAAMALAGSSPAGARH